MRPINARRVARHAVALLAIIAAGAALYRRVRALTLEPRIVVAPRVSQLMYNRLFALEVIAYAETYRRPPYALDSMFAHLDSTDRTRVRALLVDLWRRPIRYDWDWCEFRVLSDAGDAWRRVPSTEADSMWREGWAHGRDMPPTYILESYAWPTGIGRTDRCGKGP